MINKKFLKTKIYKYLGIVLVLMLAIIPLKVFAFDADFYSSNDIVFYSPSDTGCEVVTSSILTSLINKKNQEATAIYLSTTNFLGNKNKPMNAVQIAAIMGNIQKESGFNPNAGSLRYEHMGIAQWSAPGRWDSVKDPKIELASQLDFIKEELDGTFKDSLYEFWSLSDPIDLKRATFAIARNYIVAVNSGKETSPTAWTTNTEAESNIQDLQSRQLYANAFYDEYSHLTGSSARSNCGRLASGGMSLAQAQKFMQAYKDLEPKTWDINTLGTKYNIFNAGCSGGPLANCVAFSQYFINRYTTKQYLNTANGSGVVKSLIAIGFTNGGKTPKAYAVFSKANGSVGHTGVVLNVDTNTNRIIIGEVSCGDSLDSIKVSEKNLNDYTNKEYTYAYTDGFLRDAL